MTKMGYETPGEKKNTSAQDLELAHVKNVGKLPLVPGFLEIISSVAHESHECCDFPHDDLKQAAQCETNWGKLRENPKKKAHGKHGPIYYIPNIYQHKPLESSPKRNMNIINI